MAPEMRKIPNTVLPLLYFYWSLSCELQFIAASLLTKPLFLGWNKKEKQAVNKF